MSHVFSTLTAQEKPEPPRFLVNLVDTVARDGTEVVLTCTVTGSPKPEISWYHNDKNIDRSEDFVINYDQNTGKVSQSLHS